MPLMPAVRTLVFTFFVAVSLTAFAQVRPPDNRPRNCAVYGRVAISGQPAANALVIASELTQSRNGQSSARTAADGSPIKTVFKVHADTDGLYQFTGLPAGQYQIRVLARAFISAENDLDRELGRAITLDDGETREKVNFALVRGGVITGRIMDAEGHPQIAHPVRFFLVEKEGLSKVDVREARGDLTTDDRGVYRAYGLRPGDYAVSAGDIHYFDRTSGIRKYRRTFYPDALDEKQAKIIKLSAGEEKTGIDIKLNAGGKRYQAAGRVVDTETGKPVANASISCNKVFEGENNQEESDSAYDQTDAAGNFRLAGLSSGRYRVRLNGGLEQGVEYYTEEQFFEVSGEDASGIVVKATSAGALSGLAVIEGAPNPALKAKLGQILLITIVEGEQHMQQQTFIKADGTFRVTGLPPGKVRMFASGMGDASFQLLRIERGGSEIKEELTIAKGEKINDLRMVFGQGSGVIRGQVQITGGQLPQGWHLMVLAQRSRNNDVLSFAMNSSVTVDERGRFLLEGLFTGEYVLTVYSEHIIGDGSVRERVRTPVKQNVSVTSGAEVQVTIALDLNEKQKQEER